jgi:SAM-dependent methyltransferase
MENHWLDNTPRALAFCGCVWYHKTNSIFWENGAMNLTQTFYDSLASEYDKLFLDWQATTHEQAEILNKLFTDNGFDHTAHILDCACGIGTQAIGLASADYHVTASDISEGELAEAKARAAKRGIAIRFENADFRALSKTFSEQFDIVIAMDNALPHMLCAEDLADAVNSIVNQMKDGGIFVGSIRDYDALLKDKPPYSPPYIHKTGKGQRVSFQTWDWNGDLYKLTQYIIDDGDTLNASKFECVYRATPREELTNLFISGGCKAVSWLFPEETSFYQPIVIAKK